MFCINCGARLPDGAKFCPNCGSRIVTVAPAVEEAAAKVEKIVPETMETAAAAVETVAQGKETAEIPKAAAKIEEKVEESTGDKKISPLPAPEGIRVAPVPTSTPEPEPAPAPEPVSEPEPVFKPVFEAAPEPAPEPDRAEKAAAVVGASAYSPRPAQVYTPPATQVYTGPVQPAPAGQPLHPAENTKGKKARAPAKGNAGRIVLSVFLSILLCVSILASTLVTVVRFKVNRTELNRFAQQLIDDKGAKSVLDMILGNGKKAARPARSSVRAASLGVAVTGTPHVANTVSGVDFDLGDIDLDDLENVDELLDQISEKLYDNVKNKAGWEDVKKRDIRNALDDPLVDEFLDQVTRDLIDGVLSEEGTSGKGLTPETITDFVVEHKDEIQDLVEGTGYKGEFKIDERKLEDSIRDSIGDGVSLESLPEEVTEEIDKFWEIYDLVVSLPVLIGLWILTALLIVLLIVANKRRISAVLYCVGIPALIVGILFLAGWCAMTLLPQMRDGLLSLIKTFIGKYVLVLGAGFTGGGIVFIIVKALISTVQKKNKA